MSATNLPTPEGEPVQDALGPPSAEDLQAAFAAAGLAVSVEERTLAITASADGGVLIGIFIGVPLSEFARLIVDDAYVGIKNLLQRFHRRGEVDYVVYAGHEGIHALIEFDLPPEAFMKLQGTLPNAPSNRIVYNRNTRRWQDSGEMD